jgi:hypothetical protein
MVPPDRVGHSWTRGDLCLTHHRALGLRRFPFGSIAEGKFRSQGETMRKGKSTICCGAILGTRIQGFLPHT